MGSETADAACLAVDGNRATIGVRFPSAGDGFFFLEDNPAGQDRFVRCRLRSRTVRDRLSVPGPSTLATRSTSGSISIHDALRVLVGGPARSRIRLGPGLAWARCRRPR